MVNLVLKSVRHLPVLVHMLGSYIVHQLFQVKVMKESALPFSTPAHASLRTVPKPQEQRVIAAPTSAPVETIISGTNAKEDGNQLEAEGVQFIDDIYLNLSFVVCYLVMLV